LALAGVPAGAKFLLSDKGLEYRSGVIHRTGGTTASLTATGPDSGTKYGCKPENCDIAATVCFFLSIEA
jgi:hypothetical protein